jgi:hypothetical protein
MKVQVAWAAAILAGFAGYELTRLILRHLDVTAWKDAWNRTPEPRRQAIRNTLMAEEGLAVNGD